MALRSPKQKSPGAEGQLLEQLLITAGQVWNGAGRAQLLSRLAPEIPGSRNHHPSGHWAPSRQGKNDAAGGAAGQSSLPRYIKLRFCTITFLV